MLKTILGEGFSSVGATLRLIVIFVFSVSYLTGFQFQMVSSLKTNIAASLELHESVDMCQGSSHTVVSDRGCQKKNFDCQGTYCQTQFVRTAELMEDPNPVGSQHRFATNADLTTGLSGAQLFKPPRTNFLI